MLRNGLANSILLSVMYSVLYNRQPATISVSYCMKLLPKFNLCRFLLSRLMSNVRYTLTISLATTTLGKCNAKDGLFR